MRNTFYLALISLLLFAGLSCGEKEKAKPEKLPELSEQLPELPDFKKEPWQKTKEERVNFFLKGEKVELLVFQYYYGTDITEGGSLLAHDYFVDVLHNAEGREWIALYSVDRDYLQTLFHLFEFNEQGSEKFVQSLLDLTSSDIKAFFKKRYDLSPGAEQK